VIQQAMPQELQPVPKILLIKEIALQPNPAKNIAYLSFSAARQYNFTLELFDITGSYCHKKRELHKQAITIYR